jgi:hypothetical protein
MIVVDTNIICYFYLEKPRLGTGELFELLPGIITNLKVGHLPIFFQCFQKPQKIIIF